MKRGKARTFGFGLRAHIALIWLLLLPVMARAQQPAASGEPPLVITLDKAISMALEQNRDILIAAQDRTRANAQVSEARSGVFPSLDISGVYTRNIDKPVLFLAPNTPINPSNTTARFELGSDNA
ncbi:MAG TPA: TolC family protein, partial [bacterium]|nr:TolC family protein [bacterium]